MNMPDRPKIYQHDYASDGSYMDSDEASAYMDALEAKVKELESYRSWDRIRELEAKVAALETQIAQAYNDGVEDSAQFARSKYSECLTRKWDVLDVARGIYELKRPVVEAQKEGE